MISIVTLAVCAVSSGGYSLESPRGPLIATAEYGRRRGAAALLLTTLRSGFTSNSEDTLLNPSIWMWQKHVRRRITLNPPILARPTLPLVGRNAGETTLMPEEHIAGLGATNEIFDL